MTKHLVVLCSSFTFQLSNVCFSTCNFFMLLMYTKLDKVKSIADFVLIDPHKNCAKNDFLKKYGDYIREKGIK